MSKVNATAFLNLALLALYAGHEDQAIRSFKDALEINPDLVDAHIGMGLAYSRIEKYEEMAESFRKAINLNPSAVRMWAKVSIPSPHRWISFSPEYAYIKGKMAEFLHDQDEADALARLGAAHISNGFDEAAVTALEYSLSLLQDCEASLVLLAIAYLLIKARDEEKAVKLGKSSILKKTVPKLAKIILSS